MGGLGSGNWYRWQTKKPTVEESLTLAIKDFRKPFPLFSSGTFSWQRYGGQSSVAYSLTSGDSPTLTLRYGFGNSENISYSIRLQSTPTQFGGRRWWFTCPLVVRGVPCRRRVGKLYVAPGSKYFGCRSCQGLTYESSQTAHQTARAFGQIAKVEGCGDLAKEIGRALAKRYK